MPQIIVAADRAATFGQGAVTLREGVTVADFESEHFATQLVERLGWAVEDAHQLERTPGDAEKTAEEPDTAQEPDRAEEPDRAPVERAADLEPVSAR